MSDPRSWAAQRLEAARREADSMWLEAVACVERGDNERAGRLLAGVSQRALLAAGAANTIGALRSALFGDEDR